MPPKRKRSPTAHTAHAKLPRLPDGYRPSHRPLSHPAIPSPASSTTKTVYISARTPFISAVKRVQSLLAAAEKRETQAALDKSRRGKGVDLEAAAELLSQSTNAKEVLLKGTGKAVEKTLSLGLWFQSQDGYSVVVKTGSVGTVDDVVKVTDDDGVASPEDAGEAEEQIEAPRSRLRYTSMVEISVTKR